MIRGFSHLWRCLRQVPGRSTGLNSASAASRRCAVLWGALLLASAVVLPSAQALGVVQTPAMRFGESAVVSGCLRLTVQSYRDRSGDLENYDWVTVITQNECGHAVSGLLVELYLVSLDGALYGRRFWTLEPGQALLPTGTRKERFAIPDPDSFTAGAWAMRVLDAKRKVLR